MQFTLPLPCRPDLDKVHDHVRADDAGKWDVTPFRQEVALIRGRLALPAAYESDCPTSLALTPWATGQLCRRLGIPAPYFRRCPACLQDVQVNHWLRFAPNGAAGNGAAGVDEFALQGAGDTDEVGDAAPSGEQDDPPAAAARYEPWLLRGRKDRLRGVLSSRYARMDNAQLLDALRPLLHTKESRLEVKDFSLSEESLHLRLVDPQLARDVLKDDRLFVGFHVSNSEVGRHSVRVDALVWRLVCSNGLIRLVNGRSLFRQRHVAWDPDRFASALQGAVAEAAVEGAGLLERLAWATKEPVADVPAAIRSLSEQWRLSERTQELVTASLLSERSDQQETVYGLVNAFTSAAHHLSPEERYRVETLAGRLAETGVPQGRRLAALPVPGDEVTRNGFGAPSLSRNGRSRAGAFVGG